ncbi:unnamed protein product [Victoria cruziana]
MDVARTPNFHISNEDDSLDLPPGFRFHPTDEELVTHYLSPKVLDPGFHSSAVAEVDLNKCEPWDLPRKAKMGEKEWYFFSMRDRKYPTGMRTNRATEAGYWKATGKDKEVYRGRNILVGMKKTLVFYRGRAPKGEKTNWVMHEYRLEGKGSYYNLPKISKDEWVVCRIFQKPCETKIRGPTGSDQFLRMNSFGDELDSSTLPPLLDSPCFPGEIDDDFKALNNMPRFTTTCMDGQGIKNQKLLLESYPHQSQSIPHMATAGSLFSSTPRAPGKLQTPLFLSSQSMGKFTASFHHHATNNSVGAAGAPFPYSYDMGTFDHMLRSNMEVSRNIMMMRQCKDEQKVESPQQEAAYGRFSNQSMITASQDTGLSTDVTTEISSVVSRKQLGSSSRLHDDQDGLPSSSAGPVDLECLWNY